MSRESSSYTIQLQVIVLGSDQSDQSRALDTDAVMELISALQSTWDGGRVLDAWLGDEEALEPACQGGIIFRSDILLVFYVAYLACKS